MAFPPIQLGLLLALSDRSVLVNLAAELGVIVDRSADQARRDSKVFGNLVDIAMTGSDRGHDLVHVEPGADHERLATPRRAKLEPDQRVSLEAEGLAEEPVGEGIARLATSGRGRVEEVDRPWREPKRPLHRARFIPHVSQCNTDAISLRAAKGGGSSTPQGATVGNRDLLIELGYRLVFYVLDSHG